MDWLRKDPAKADYWRQDMPTSPGRIPLIAALARLCSQRFGFDLEAVALNFDEEGRIFLDEDKRSLVDRAARDLGEAFAAGEIDTYSRAFGGGIPIHLSPSDWELDDFRSRFAGGALAPSRPFDADAIPTHWIFVDEKGLERLLAADRSVVPPTDGSGFREPESGKRGFPSTAADQDRHIRMRELEKLTGMSRATIYRRIKSGRFPTKIPMDGNISAWRERDIAEWLANPH